VLADSSRSREAFLTVVAAVYHLEGKCKTQSDRVALNFQYQPVFQVQVSLPVMHPEGPLLFTRSSSLIFINTGDIKTWIFLTLFLSESPQQLLLQMPSNSRTTASSQPSIRNANKENDLCKLLFHLTYGLSNL